MVHLPFGSKRMFAVYAYRFQNTWQPVFQDASTQTDITLESLLVTIPRSLIQETPPPGGERGLVRRNSSSLVDRVVHRALSMDSLSRSYIPPQHLTWRSYVAMQGMHTLQQVIHT